LIMSRCGEAWAEIQNEQGSDNYGKESTDED